VEGRFTMSDPSASRVQLPQRSRRWALRGVLVIGLGYTTLYTLLPDNAPIALLLFPPGVLSVMVLIRAGFSLEECYLRAAPISIGGLALLAGSLLLMPLVWFTGRWAGWRWLDALVYAPASGVSQELFFRAALLPVLLAAFKSRPFLGNLAHAALFALWHIPKAATTAPLGGVVGVVVVTFLCGILWGSQVRRDGTVLWLMGYHTMILVVNSLLTWG
jgi:hypothetical protein